jgi:acyl-CoA hydrolase
MATIVAAGWSLTDRSAKMGASFGKRSGVNMNFHTRKWVKPEDLNPNGTLFGGSLLRWIDEEAAIYAIVQLGNQRVVTKYISEINFVSASRQGDIIELGITATEFGRTSITLTCEVRNKITRKSILTVEKMVFVNLGEDGLPAPHGRTEIKYVKDQFQEDEPVTR